VHGGCQLGLEDPSYIVYGHWLNGATIMFEGVPTY
jgi:acyl-coenzyme A synthetase/AMP-(fatty) acid ligase